MALNDQAVLIRVIVGDDVYTHYIELDEFILGRSDDADLTLNIEGISRQHAKILVRENKILLKDLNSKYGTFLQGEKIPTNEPVEYEKSCQVFLASPKAAFTFEIVSTFNNPEYLNWKEADKVEFKDQIKNAIGKLSTQKEKSDHPIQRANNERHPPTSLKGSTKRELTYAAKAVMLTTDLHKLNEVRKQKRDKIAELDQLILRTQDRIDTLNNNEEKLNANIKTLKEGQEQGELALNQMKENFETAKAKYTGRIDEYKKSLINFKAEYKVIELNKNKAVERENLAEARLKDLVAHQSETEQMIQNLQERANPLKLEISESEAKLEALLKDIAEHKEEEEIKRRLFEDAKLALEEEEANLSAAKDKAEGQRLITAELEDKAAVALKLAEEKKEEKTKLELEQSKLEKDFDSAQSEYEALVEDIRGLNSELELKEEKFEKLNSDYSAKKEELRQAEVDLLKESQKKDDLEEELASLNYKYEQLSESLAEVRLENQKAREEKAGMHDFFVSKNQQKSNLEKIVSKLSENELELSKSLEAKKNELDASTAELQKVQAGIYTETKDLESVKAEKGSLEEASRLLSKENTKLELNIQDNKKDLKDTDSELKDLNKRLKKIKEEYQRDKNDFDSLTEDYEPLKAEVRKINIEKQNLISDKAKIEIDLEKLVVQESELKANLDEGSTKLKELKDEKTRVLDQKNDLLADIDELKVLKDEKHEEFLSTKQLLSQISEDKNKADKEMETTSFELEKIRFEHEKKETKLEVLEDKIKNSESQYDRLGQDIKRKESDLEGLEEKLVALNKRHNKKEADLLEEQSLLKAELEKKYNDLLSGYENQQQTALNTIDEHKSAIELLVEKEGSLKDKITDLGNDIDDLLIKKQDVIDASEKLKEELNIKAKEEVAEEIERQKERAEQERKEAVEVFENKIKQLDLQLKDRESLLEKELAKVASEKEKQIKDLETQFNEQKVYLTKSFQEQKRNLEFEMQSHKHQYQKRFEYEMEQFIANKPKNVKELEGEFVDLVLRSFDLRNEDEEKTLTDMHYVPRVDAGKKAFQHYGIRAMLVLALSMLFFFRAEIGTQIAKLKPDTSKPSSGDLFVESVRRQIASKPKYVPESRFEYQKTYTENVLHYDNYLRNFSSEDFHKNRLTELSKFFFEDLKLSENVIPPFIAEEKILIRELMEMRSKINPRFEKEGISRMRKREHESRAKLIKLLGGFENYQKFRKKDTSFF